MSACNLRSNSTPATSFHPSTPATVALDWHLKTSCMEDQASVADGTATPLYRSTR
jgi:hypothetical protein